MAGPTNTHTLQDRYSPLVDAKLRNTLVTKDNLIFNNRYEGNPKAGKVKIPVRDTEVEVSKYDRANGLSPKAGGTTYRYRNHAHAERVQLVRKEQSVCRCNRSASCARVSMPHPGGSCFRLPFGDRYRRQDHLRRYHSHGARLA